MKPRSLQGRIVNYSFDFMVPEGIQRPVRQGGEGHDMQLASVEELL